MISRGYVDLKMQPNKKKETNEEAWLLSDIKSRNRERTGNDIQNKYTPCNYIPHSTYCMDWLRWHISPVSKTTTMDAFLKVRIKLAACSYKQYSVYKHILWWRPCTTEWFLWSRDEKGHSKAPPQLGLEEAHHLHRPRPAPRTTWSKVAVTRAERETVQCTNASLDLPPVTLSHGFCWHSPASAITRSSGDSIPGFLIWRLMIPGNWRTLEPTCMQEAGLIQVRIPDLRVGVVGTGRHRNWAVDLLWCQTWSMCCNSKHFYFSPHIFI